MNTSGPDMDADAIRERLRCAEGALSLLVACDIPFIRNGIVPVLVQLRELRAFIDVDAALPYSAE